MKCCDYNAGMMREPVTFQRRTRSADGAGSWSETWATISGTPSRGHVTQTSGREAVLHGRKEAHAAVKIVTRYCRPAPVTNWIELTEADVASITFQNLGPVPMFVQATTGPAPTSIDPSIEYPAFAKETNVNLADLFPGVSGAVRLWAYAPTAVDVSVSHAGGINKTVALVPYQPPANWVELTEANVANVTIQNVGYSSVFVQATTGSAPTTTAGSIEYPGAAKETNVGLSDLFPGVIGANRLWAYAPASTEVFVSHAGGVNKKVSVAPLLDYSIAIREADRVQVRAINYNILSVNNLEFKNQWLEIIAERGVPA